MMTKIAKSKAVKIFIGIAIAVTYVVNLSIVSFYKKWESAKPASPATSTPASGTSTKATSTKKISKTAHSATSTKAASTTMTVNKS